MALKFGDRIEFDVRFKRARRSAMSRHGYMEHWRLWDLSSVPLATGIVIGKRTLWNGTVHNEDGYKTFIFFDHVPAYLVAINMSDKPVYIPCDQYNEEERIKYAKENY